MEDGGGPPKTGETASEEAQHDRRAGRLATDGTGEARYLPVAGGDEKKRTATAKSQPGQNRSSVDAAAL